MVVVDSQADSSTTGPAGVAGAAGAVGLRARLRRLIRDPAALTGVIILVLLVLVAILAPVLAPEDPNQQDLSRRLLPPLSDGNLLGTDHLGRDILSRIIYGARISLLVGTVSVVIGAAIGIVLGLLAGYFGGLPDLAINWLTNVSLAFPFILLVIAVVAVLGANLTNLIVVLGITSWAVYVRILRGQVMSLKEQEFVAAARVGGARAGVIMFRHLLPNGAPALMVIATFEVARMTIMEAALSFLGLGVQPSIPSWGAMLADGRSYLQVAWWLATLPGLAILLTVLAVNLVGDWLRDEFDPRLVAAA